MRRITQSMTAFQLYVRLKNRTKIKMSVKDFRTIYTLFTARLNERLVAGERFQAGGIGSIYVSSIDTRPNMIDWKTTADMWKQHPHVKRKQFVYQLSENKLYTFIWSRGRISNFYSKYMYRMKTSSFLRRALYKAIVIDKKEYV